MIRHGLWFTECFVLYEVPLQKTRLFILDLYILSKILNTKKLPLLLVRKSTSRSFLPEMNLSQQIQTIS